MTELTQRIAEQAHTLRGPEDLDPLVRRLASARYVLIGEASHGTAEFYRWRAELTKRLIAEREFSFVGVEGDWPDCHRLHCCVVGAPGEPNDPAAVLWEFGRWPRWMWANEEVAEFAAWLRTFNTTTGRAAGFHGLDVYSLWESLDAVSQYLAEHEPVHVDAALRAYRCFEPYRDDPLAYAFATRIVPEECESEVVTLLTQLRQRRLRRSAPGPGPAFAARQNAEVVAGAERYYRALMRGDHESWNVRDHHMTDTLERLMSAYGPRAKAVVWAHNSHVGDARATDMADAGMVNLGQLVRERHRHDEVAVVGFGSHGGSVIASDFWGGPVGRMPAPDAPADSVEGLLHRAVPDRDSMWLLRDTGDWSGEVRGHRAIGVVYHPRRDRRRNYVPTVLDRRYDAFIHCDRTDALTPLHAYEFATGEPETYPVGK